MDPKLTLVVIVTLGAGQWMLVAGLSRHALHWRRPARRCPSCGRLRPDCRCRP